MKSSYGRPSKEEGLAKLQRYCAYQDRCHQEVRTKLLDLGFRGQMLEEIITELIIEKFLDEERFARSFCRGKHRLKKWGRNKIKNELKIRDISPYCIKAGLSEIDETAYNSVLYEIIEKKNDQWSDILIYERKQKIAQFAIRKGYESNLVWGFIHEVLP